MKEKRKRLQQKYLVPVSHPKRITYPSTWKFVFLVMSSNRQQIQLIKNFCFLSFLMKKKNLGRRKSPYSLYMFIVIFIALAFLFYYYDFVVETNVLCHIRLLIWDVSWNLNNLCAYSRENVPTMSAPSTAITIKHHKNTVLWMHFAFNKMKRRKTK